MNCPAWRLVCYDTLPSTSDLCIERAEAGEPAGLAILARTQTRARGSRGRGWSEAAGTFALSVLLRPGGGSLWPFIAALAFSDALCLTERHREAIRLKWPNDVMLDGRKLGGILIEASASPDGWLVAGFGANLAQAPAVDGREAACLAELGPPPSAEGVAGRLLDGLTARYAQRNRAAEIRREWLARAHPPGTMLQARTAAGQVKGAFSSIAEDGTLLLEVDGRIRSINTGEILVLPGSGRCSTHR